MTDKDFMKVLPGHTDFSRTFFNERNAEDDLVIQGESKLEKEINHVLTRV